MEINRKLLYNDKNAPVVDNKLVEPNPGVLYLSSTNRVYFNNAVLDNYGPRPEEPVYNETRNIDVQE